MESAGVVITRCRGEAIRPFVAEMAALRIAVFREWPYLYQGDATYEREYLSLYVNSPTSLAVLVRDEGRLVGVSTAIGLEEEPEAITRPVAEAGYDPASVLYAGESLVVTAWRGRGLGARFFAEREAHARRLGRSELMFCRVVRDVDDPRRPAGARAQDDFWRRQGYAPLPIGMATLAWRDVGDAVDTPKRMAFWGRRLAP